MHKQKDMIWVNEKVEKNQTDAGERPLHRHKLSNNMHIPILTAPDSINKYK